MLFYPLFLVVVPLALLEALFQLLPVSSAPHILPVNEKTPIARLQPNVDYVYSVGWDFAIRTKKRSNNFGYNHRWDYDPAATTPLLMVVGDSFVEAHQVDAGKSAAELLHGQLAGKGRVYSIGLSGAPLSQYLVFARYAAETFRPDAMAFVIISNDFDESLLKYKADPRFHYFDETRAPPALRRIDYRMSGAKKTLRQSAFARYAILNVALPVRIEEMLQAARGELRTRPPHLGVRDADPPAVLEERIRDSKRAADYFLERLPGMSGLASERILFVLDGMRPALYSEETLRLAEGSYFDRMRRYFAAAAEARGYTVLDLQPAFTARHRQDGSRFEFPTDGHWNELGHRVIAEAIGRTQLVEQIFPGMRLWH